MLNFVICDDNSNILDKVEKMLQSIFVKHTFDARVVFKSEVADTGIIQETGDMPADGILSERRRWNGDHFLQQGD